MASQWYDRQGRRVTLGKEIGRGGEGAVYEIAENTALLAKIYEKPVSTEKIAKLTAMSGLAAPDLVRIAAWPTNLLYDKPNGLLKGFLMPKVPGHCEIHEVYSPAQRKQKLPQADWRFLIHIARNLAAAVDAVHAHGHVIGDLNQKGVLVQPQQGTVTLIDCDSFQIQVSQQSFLCDVGVRDFTPPELQGKSFHGIKRTSNHDNFGLAVLCFQLLFMGRHPFSGRYRGPGEDSLERAIQEYRFAYSRTANRKLMEPPPHTLQLSAVSPRVANLFERAFDEAAVRHSSRPLAQEWAQALEELQHSLRSCSDYSIHKYLSSSALCPWCEMEQATGVYLFIAIVPVSPFSSSFNVEEVWKKICTISPPGVALQPNSQPTQPPAPVPLPLTVQARHSRRTTIVIGALVFTGVTAVSVPWLGLFPVLFAVLIFVIVFHSPVNDGGEGEKRRSALRDTQERWTTVLRQWQQETSDEPFAHKLHALSQKRTEYLALAPAYQQDRTQLEMKRQDAQRQKFLEHHFIARANLKGLGPGRKATLASYGIETAADITRHAVQAVPGFGPARTQELLNWRRRIEVQFRFDPKLGTDPKDITDLEQRYARKRHDLEAVLLRGETELQQIRIGILQKRDTLGEALRSAAAQLAQAQADVSVLKILQIESFASVLQSAPIQIRYVSASIIIALLLFGVLLTRTTQPLNLSRQLSQPFSAERFTEPSRPSLSVSPQVTLPQSPGSNSLGSSVHNKKVKEAAKQALQRLPVQTHQNEPSLSSIESRENAILETKTQRAEGSIGTYRIVQDTKLLKEPRADADLVTQLRRGMKVNVVSIVEGKWLRVESKRADRLPGYLRSEDAVREETPTKEEENKSNP